MYEEACLLMTFRSFSSCWHVVIITQAYREDPQLRYISISHPGCTRSSARHLVGYAAVKHHALLFICCPSVHPSCSGLWIENERSKKGQSNSNVVNFKTLKARTALKGNLYSHDRAMGLPATRHKWTRPTLTPSRRLVLDLPTQEGWKADLT